MPKESNKNFKIQTKKPGQFILPSGSKGFLITCRRGRERNAKDELLQLFEEWAEKLSSQGMLPELELKEEKVFSSVEEELEAELAELKDTKKKKLFSFMDTSIDCVVFTKTNPAINPVLFIKTLLIDMQAKSLKKTRYTSRLIPIENSCMGKLNDIVEMSRKVIHDFCDDRGGNADPFTFSIIPSIRNNESIKRDDLITAIAALVPPENKVNLKNPEFCIIIEIINLTCGISILPDYFKLKKYNLEMIGEPSTDQIKKAEK